MCKVEGPPREEARTQEGDGKVTVDENLLDLPEGWLLTRLADFALINPRHPSGLNETQQVTFVAMAALSETKPQFDFTEDRPLFEVRKGYTHFAEGDVLFAKITPCMENGKAAIARGLTNGLGCGTTELHVVRPLEGISPDYIYQFLHQEKVRSDAAAHFSGSAGQLRVPATFIGDLKIPLPPLAEQRRIVAKVEALLARLQAARDRLARLPALLKRFRQTVLADACAGRLTEDWRHAANAIEPASKIVARLRTLRHAGYADLCKLAQSQKRHTPPKFDNLEPLVRTDLDLFELPEIWQWVDLRFLMAVDEPFCYGVVQPGPNDPHGNFLVRAGDLRNGTVQLDGLRRISKRVDAEYERSRLQGGELLVTVVGAGIGSVALAPDECVGFNIARAVAKVPVREISAKYAFFWLSSQIARRWMFGDAREVARPTLNLEQLKTLPVPLAPLDEQQQIVYRIEALFKLANAIERRVAAATARADRLTQGILAKAFRGELVPTEADLARRQGRDFESAEQLLKRIRPCVVEGAAVKGPPAPKT